MTPWSVIDTVILIKDDKILPKLQQQICNPQQKTNIHRLIWILINNESLKYGNFVIMFEPSKRGPSRPSITSAKGPICLERP